MCARHPSASRCGPAWRSPPVRVRTARRAIASSRSPTALCSIPAPISSGRAATTRSHWRGTTPIASAVVHRAGAGWDGDCPRSASFKRCTTSASTSCAATATATSTPPSASGDRTSGACRRAAGARASTSTSVSARACPRASVRGWSAGCSASTTSPLPRRCPMCPPRAPSSCPRSRAAPATSSDRIPPITSTCTCCSGQACAPRRPPGCSGMIWTLSAGPPRCAARATSGRTASRRRPAPGTALPGDGSAAARAPAVAC